MFEVNFKQDMILENISPNELLGTSNQTLQTRIRAKQRGSYDSIISKLNNAISQSMSLNLNATLISEETINAEVEESVLQDIKWVGVMMIFIFLTYLLMFRTVILAAYCLMLLVLTMPLT